MICLDQIETLIVTPPHTASGNLHRALCSPEIGGFWAIGPNPGDGQNWDHHIVKPDNSRLHFRRLLVWRDPIERAAGLLCHLRYWHETKGWRYVSQSDFVDMLQGKFDVSWFYRWTIARMIGNEQIDGLIHFGTLQDSVSLLVGKTVQLPVDDERPRIDWTASELERIKVWGQPDIELRQRLPFVA